MEYQGTFWENIFLKVYKINIIRKTILFHENKLFPSEVIALLVTPYSIDWQIFFSPDIQPNITFSTEIIATHSNSFKNP